MVSKAILGVHRAFLTELLIATRLRRDYWSPEFVDLLRSPSGPFTGLQRDLGARTIELLFLVADGSRVARRTFLTRLREAPGSGC